ncbi:DUF3368 domain-containing protein [Methylomagnum sp.]
MRIEQVVVNASPLISLFRAGLESLLPHLFTEIVVPEAVWAEVTSQTYNDPAARGLPVSNWALKTPTPTCPDVALWNLGAGETAVLSFARQHPGYTAIIDDRAARRCARVLGIRIQGSPGVVVLAKRRGIIPSSREALRRLQKAGLWLSEELIEKLSAEDRSG